MYVSIHVAFAHQIYRWGVLAVHPIRRGLSSKNLMCTGLATSSFSMYLLYTLRADRAYTIDNI